MAKLKQKLLDALPKRLRRTLRLQRMLHRLRALRAPVTARPHGLPVELILSLTSYPARFEHLHLTLMSLLNQTIAADRLILWIAEDDMQFLPRRVLRLKKRGLEIRSVANDLRSFKKLVFALESFPEACLVTADDDLFYLPDWLEPLVEGYEPGVIACRRAHRIPGFQDRLIPAYRQWESEVEDAAARRPCADILPTTGAGALFPPGSLHADTVDSSAFMALCSRADDLWFYMMARKAGSLSRKVGGYFEQIAWPGSQEVALFNENIVANDEQMAALVERYGHPADLGQAQEA